MSSIIKKLDTETVNKIAAGEIIISPVNCMKELIENSIDAGATKIDISIQNNGFKLIQIQDNGMGIGKENFGLLCKRFTTSKITCFDDLRSIQTFGFRGEALSSICNISHLKIITKTKAEPFAYECEFDSSGNVIGEKPIAGNTGTLFIINDIFYNVPSRLKSLTIKDELKKIVECVCKYAINNNGISFSLKRVEDNKMLYTCREESTMSDRIRLLINSSINKFLIDFECDGDDTIGFLGCKGIITNLSYSNELHGNKKSSNSASKAPVFFINNRLIACEHLKRALLSTYNSFLPKTASRPFIYLALSINSENVDVNVHPTKKEVFFVYESEIIEKICDTLRELLQKQDVSRTFKTHSPSLNNSDTFLQSQIKDSKKKDYRDETRLVRVDALQSKLQFKPLLKSNIIKSANSSFNTAHTETASECSQLQSIKNLKTALDLSVHQDLITFFQECKYIGIIDSEKRICSVQVGLGLYMLDYATITNSLIYQLGLRNIGGFGCFETDILVTPCLELLKTEQENIRKVLAVFREMKAMFKEYFNINIIEEDEDIRITQLPILLPEYTPSLTKLPLFLYKLGLKVNYEEEEACLKGILKELSLWYIPEIIPQDEIKKRSDLDHILESLIIPMLRTKNFLPTKALVNDIIEIANLPGLYKIFERC
ncbi:hypothetical protein QEN19_000670 [Hanseniaspora menglaensis]